MNNWYILTQLPSSKACSLRAINGPHFSDQMKVRCANPRWRAKKLLGLKSGTTSILAKYT